MKDTRFAAAINPQLVCLVSTALYFALRSWRTGKYVPTGDFNRESCKGKPAPKSKNPIVTDN